MARLGLSIGVMNVPSVMIWFGEPQACASSQLRLPSPTSVIAEETTQIWPPRKSEVPIANSAWSSVKSRVGVSDSSAGCNCRILASAGPAIANRAAATIRNVASADHDARSILPGCCKASSYPMTSVS